MRRNRLRNRAWFRSTPRSPMRRKGARADPRHRRGRARRPFQIAEVVARIDAFWRNREGAESSGDAVYRPPAPAESFRFETDAKGVIRWVDGVSRAPIVGLSLDLQGAPAAAGSRVDGVASGAFRPPRRLLQRAAAGRRRIGCRGRLADVGHPRVRSRQRPLHRLSRHRAPPGAPTTRRAGARHARDARRFAASARP
ncbi:MAG: hypothetical protein WDN24_03125 [Sphingomonas sp.]